MAVKIKYTLELGTHNGVAVLLTIFYANQAFFNYETIPNNSLE